MATSKSKKSKTKKRPAVKAKAKARTAGKKATSERVLKDINNEIKLMESPRDGANPEPLHDPGHSAGHKKISSKNQPFAAFSGKISQKKTGIAESDRIRVVIPHRSTKRG